MKKRLLSVLLVLCMLVSMFASVTVSAAVPWPATSGIKTYVISTGNDTTVYQTATSSGKYGTIYASDLITINGYSGSRLKVTYPVSNGRTKTGYIDKSKVTAANINSAIDRFTATGTVTVYRRAGGGQTLGSIAKNDTVYRIATSGSYTQVIYPISGGYKMGWCKNSSLPTGGPAGVNVAEGTYVILSAVAGNKAVDINGASTADCANVQLYEKNGTQAQSFKITRSGSYYTIINTKSNKALDVANGSTASGANVWQYTQNGTNAQKWTFEDAGNGYYYIKSALGNYLDVNGAGTANGTNIQVYEGNRTNAQKFKLAAVGSGNPSPSNTVAASSPLNSSQGINICFNHIYYANTYADLKAAFGYDRNRLLTHWQNNGIREGRTASPVFDPQYYLQANADVAGVFGSKNYAAAYSHFLSNGCNEGRISSAYYHGSYYRTRYSDLSSMSSYNLASHYLNYGINEGRWANSAGKKPGNMNPKNENVVPSNAVSGFDPIWPCANTYTVTTLYRYSSGSVHSCRFKYGIDIGAPYGENVLAVESGTVIRSEYSTTSGFGNWIMIQHANGKVSLYAHLSSRNVSVGTKVSKGQVIGQVGNSSAKYSIGAHLHFELGNSNTSGAGGDAYQEYYKSKYANKIVLTQAAKKYNTP